MVATTANITVRARWEGKDVERGVKTVDRDMDRLKSTMQRMAPILRGIGALMGVAVGVQMLRQTVAMADAWKGYENRIRLFTNSAKQLQATQNELFQISQRTRVSMDSTVALYAKLSVANKSLGLDTDALNGVIETISQSLIISGGSAESANAAVIQLGQGLASGVLRGEELNSVMEQAPRLAMALAQGMDVPIGKLRELGAAGQITATQVITALQSQSAAVGSEFAKIVPTVETSWLKLTDAVGKYISELDRSIGLTDRLAGAINDVADAVANAGAEEAVKRTSQVTAADPLGRGTSVPERLITGLVDAVSNNGGLEASIGDAIREGQVKSLQSAAAAFVEEFRNAPGGAPGVTRDITQTARFGRTDSGIGTLGGRRSDGGLTGGAATLGSAAGVGAMLDTTLAGSGGTPEQLQLQARAAEALASSDEELLQVRQRLEVALARQNGLGETWVDTLQDVHKAELQRFQTETKEKEDEKARRAADIQSRKDAAHSQRDYTEKVNAATAATKLIAPELGAFVDAAAQLAQGNFLAAGVGLLAGVMDAFGGGTDSTQQYTIALREAEEAQRSNLETLQQIAIAAGGAAAVEVRQLQLNAVQPLLDLFRQMREASSSTFVEDLGTFIEDSRKIDQRSSGRRNTDTFRLFNSVEGGVGGLLDGIETAFGEGATIEDAIRNMFSVEDAFRNLSDAALDLASPLERATVATFDIQEQAIRRQAQGAFNAAGGDVLEQAKAFSALKTSIDDLARTERAALRSARGIGTPTIGAGADPAAKVTGGDDGVVLDAASVIDAGVVTPVLLPWASAVQMVDAPEQRHAPEGYDAFVVIPSDLTPYERHWHQAVNMVVGDPEHRLRPSHWGNIVWVPGQRDESLKYERHWHQAVRMVIGDLDSRHRPSHWGNLVDLSNIPKYVRPFTAAVSMTSRPDEAPRHKPYHWLQIVDLGGVPKYQRAFSEAVSMSSGSGYDQRHRLAHWSQVLDVQQAGKITVNYADIIRFSGRPRKISIRDIVDMSELEGIVEGINARSANNRTTGSSSSRDRLSGADGDGATPGGSGFGWPTGR